MCTISVLQRLLKLEKASIVKHHTLTLYYLWLLKIVQIKPAATVLTQNVVSPMSNYFNSVSLLRTS